VGKLAEAIPEVLPLRGIGPRVFISYSFRDFELAGRVAAYLRQAGMQVRMEDESSLLGSPLSSTLQSRIGSAEVFLQILTETSTQSAWVAQEFSWAATAHSKGVGSHVVLPIVVGDAHAPKPIDDWSYLAVPASPDDRSLDVIRRTAMGSVATLLVDPDRPYQFAEPDLVSYCLDPALTNRRLIVDPTSVVAGMIRATVVDATERVAEYQQQIVVQQRRAYDQFLRLLSVLDAYIPEFVRRVRPIASEHWFPEEWPKQFSDVVECFVRLAVGPTVLDLVDSWPLAVKVDMTVQAVANCEAAAAEAKALQATLPYRSGAGQTFWAIGGSVGQRWLDLGFDGKEGIEGVYLFLPEDHYDEIGVLSLTAGVDSPASEVTKTDWLTIGLPQVASSRIPGRASEVAEAVSRIGWSLTDYRRSGRH
jgi:hypothetical protein